MWCPKYFSAIARVRTTIGKSEKIVECRSLGALILECGESLKSSSNSPDPTQSPCPAHSIPFVSFRDGIRVRLTCSKSDDLLLSAPPTKNVLAAVSFFSTSSLVKWVNENLQSAQPETEGSHAPDLAPETQQKLLGFCFLCESAAVSPPPAVTETSASC